MMVLVAILAQTGVFDYLAVYAFKVYLMQLAMKYLVNCDSNNALLDYERQSLATNHLSLSIHWHIVGCVR